MPARMLGSASQFRQRLSIPRRDGISDRQVVVAYGGRFFDELLSGLPDTLMPTIQRSLGLSLTQVSLLRQTMDYVAAGIEPVNGVLLDVWQRKWLMAWGAVGTALSIMLVGVAPTFLILLAAYVLYGMASGPLAHTGDVLLVEMYPQAPDRAFTRSTLFDSIGALLGPLLVATTLFLDLSWRWLLLAVGSSSLFYALFILRTGLPLPQRRDQAQKHGLLATIRQNIRDVAGDHEARRWLTYLFFYNVLETPRILQTVWLAQSAGMSQQMIGVYKGAELLVGFVSLLALDRWRQRSSIRHVQIVVTILVMILFPAWLLLPGIATKFLLMIPLAFFFTMFWPIARGGALASVPGRAGVITAIQALYGLAPLPLLFGLLADGVGLTPAMLGVHLVAGAILMWLAVTSRT